MRLLAPHLGLEGAGGASGLRGERVARILRRARRAGSLAPGGQPATDDRLVVAGLLGPGVGRRRRRRGRKTQRKAATHH